MHMWCLTKKKWKSIEVVRLIESLYTILTKGNNLWRGGKIKAKGFRLERTLNCGKVNIWGKIMEDKCCSVRLVMWLKLVWPSVIRVECFSVLKSHCPLPGMEEGVMITFDAVNYCLCVDGKREGRKFLLYLLFLHCLQLKIIICQSGVFWGSIFECPSEGKFYRY